VITGSNTAEKDYVKITKKNIGKNLRQFSIPTLSSSTYLVVKAVTENGEEITRSFPYFCHVEDNNPPAAPVGLTGNVNEQGQATISWSQNKEPDLLGYRLFSSNSMENEFSELTQYILSSPVFFDSLNLATLNKKVYYRVVAVDQNYNVSGYSDAISIAIPDTIPPAAPVFVKNLVTTKNIELAWKSSPSNDVVKYTLSRISIKDSSKTILSEWSKEKAPNHYLDNSAEKGTDYIYQITAFDGAANGSSDQSQRIMLSNTPPQAVTEFSATIDRESKTILLKWHYSEPIKRCLIYRRRNSEQLSLYQSLAADAEEFLDNLTVPNNTYSYKIQLILESGVKTEISKELKVPF
jgi:uncharacterized protein